MAVNIRSGLDMAASEALLELHGRERLGGSTRGLKIK